MLDYRGMSVVRPSVPDKLFALTDVHRRIPVENDDSERIPAGVCERQLGPLAAFFCVLAKPLHRPGRRVTSADPVLDGLPDT